jgi:hypothetical protein
MPIHRARPNAAKKSCIARRDITEKDLGSHSQGLRTGAASREPAANGRTDNLRQFVTLSPFFRRQLVT